MKEEAVKFAASQIDAEVAAAALRAAHLRPRVVRDDPMLGIAGGVSIGRFVVLVPEKDAAHARAVLDEPVMDEREDNPILRMVTIVVLISALLLATPFVAQACYGSR